MSEPEHIIRIAARGDGVTADGTHVAGGLPGDLIEDGRIVQRGPHHADPPCPHFGTCGGCQLQHADEISLKTFVHDRVVNAARGQDLHIGEILPVHLSPPNSRRRTTLHAMRTQNGAVIGFREANSHKIVDLRECYVLDTRLVKLVAPLRAFVGDHGPNKGAVDIQLALADQGVDLGLSNFPIEGLAATEAVLDFARASDLARLTVDQGFGPETVWEPEPVTITMSGVPIGMPAGAFLQATQDAEDRMNADARDWIGNGGVVADLFAGLGTFAFALREGRKVLAVEGDQAAHFACKAAGARAAGAVLALHRDLFRNPLQSDELNRFAAVLLDPPRAGARAQADQIAKSTIGRAVYVSCNPSSWARDAAQLIESGFKLKKLRPIGQFRWSTHVELVSLFER